MDFIKIKSSYVKQTKHRDVNDGVIFEKDNSTLGGLSIISTSQVPIYNSGNFIITTDPVDPIQHKTSNIKWLNNGDSDIWSLNTMEESSQPLFDDVSNDKNIKLKRNFRSLLSFAYYGSLSELIRESLVHIIKTFPSELYSSPTPTSILYSFKNTAREDPKVFILGEEDMYGNSTCTDSEGNNIFISPTYLVNNPFKLDIHTCSSYDENTDSSKFMMWNENWRNYEILNGNEELVWEIDEKPTITQITYLYQDESGQNNLRFATCKGELVAKINFSDYFICYAYIGEGNEIVYLTTEEYANMHIRPKEEKMIEFRQGLHDFEDYLLTENTSSLIKSYSCVFEVLEDDGQGYVKKIEKFILPLDSSHYNIDINSISYEAYVERLFQIGNFYDEHFTDNLYRSMTHESIKNFDWTYTRDYQEGEEEEYVIGGNRFSNLIRLFGREFDDIKGYIDAISNVDNVTYSQLNNIPDYFLSDYASQKGWDISTIIPFSLTEYFLDDGEKNILGDDDRPNIDEKQNKYNNNGQDIQLFRTFNPTINLEIQPYYPNSCIPNGTFLICDCQTQSIQEIPNSTSTQLFYHNECDGKLYKRIVPYYNVKKYTSTSVNNTFLINLILNSKSIFKKKGTIEGIEAILGLFGLKSKRWVQSLSITQKRTECDGENLSYIHPFEYDYEIKEYTSFTRGIRDMYNECQNKTWIDWYNTTKLIPYQEDKQYQGLPIISYTSDEDKCNDLYPYFTSSDDIDGNPYYQMNGGWLIKSQYEFDKDNNIIVSEESNVDNVLYTETHACNRAINYLPNIEELNSDDMNDGDVIYVENLSPNYVIVNGFDFYEIHREVVGTHDYEYFEYYASPSVTVIGDGIEFHNSLSVSNPAYFDGEDSLFTLNLLNLNSSQKVKVYLIKETNENSSSDNCAFYMGDNTVDLVGRHVMYFLNGILTPYYTFYENRQTLSHNLQEYSNYFILHNAENCTYIDEWEQLKYTDTRYLKLNAIQEKNSGNNPHVGHLLYDTGKEYITYFSNIFKYAYETERFNDECFVDGLFEFHLEKIGSIGFTNLIKRNNELINCSTRYNEYCDSKIHAFCNQILTDSDMLNHSEYYPNRFFSSKNGSLSTSTSGLTFGVDYHINEMNRLATYFDNTSSDNTVKYGYNDNGEEIDEIEDIKDIYNSSTIVKGLPINDVTHQIVNTKRVDVIFNIYLNTDNTDIYSVQSLEQKKYIDDVVLPYLEQILPTNIICKIAYQYINIDTEMIHQITTYAFAETNITKTITDKSTTTITLYNEGKTFVNGILFSKTPLSKEVKVPSTGQWEWNGEVCTYNILQEEIVDTYKISCSLTYKIIPYTQTSYTVTYTALTIHNGEVQSQVKYQKFENLEVGDNELSIDWQGERCWLTICRLSADDTQYVVKPSVIRVSCLFNAPSVELPYNVYMIKNGVESFCKSKSYKVNDLIPNSNHEPNDIESNFTDTEFNCTVNYVITQQGKPKEDVQIVYNAYNISKPTLQATATTATITYSVQKTETKLDGTPITTEIASNLSRIVEFEPNTLSTQDERSDSFFDYTYSINVPWTVILLGDCGDSGDDYLIKVVYTDDSSVTSNSKTVTSEIVFNNDKTKNVKVKSVELKEGLVSIGSQAFSGCTGLTSIVMPNSITSIGDRAFEWCYNLTAVTISNKVTTIEYSAFFNCKRLTSIIIPNSVTNIGYYAFKLCENLSTVTYRDKTYTCASTLEQILRDNKVTIGTEIFDYTKLTDCGSGPTSAYIILTLNDGQTIEINKTIAENKDIESYQSTVVSAVLNNGVTTIDDYAFSFCKSLTSVTIPDSVTSINMGAFMKCASLTSVTIPNRVTSIENQVFMDCTNLKSVTIPNNVTSINGEAFYNCQSLTSITLPNGVTSIGNFTFQKCKSLTNITIPDSITSIGKFAFSYCSSLTSITYQNITYTCLEKLRAALEDKSVTIDELCFTGISHLDDCSDEPEEKQITSTTYSVKEGSVYIQPEVIPASFTSAKLFYTLIPTYHYNDGSQSIGKDINVFAKDITFASNTLYVPTSRTDTYIDTEHDNTRVAWELTIQGQETPVTQPVLKITLNDTYEDVSVITLTVDANESVQGDIEWSLEIVSQDSGAFNPIIKDGVLTFNKHFIGKVKLTAKADNASDYKTISISCNETVTATTYQIVEGSILVSPNQVPANYTQAQLSYTLQPVYEYQLKEPVTGDNIPCKTTIQFLPNTDTKEDNRSGTYVDTEHNNIHIPWTLVIQGVEQPITDDSLAYAFILQEGEKRSVSYLTNTLDGDLITAMANKSYYKTFKEEDKNQLEEKAFNMGYVFFLVDKTCSYNIIPYEIQLGENAGWAASSFKRLITNGDKYSYDGTREITIGGKTYRIYGGYMDSDNLTLRYALSDEEVQLDDEEDNPQETDLYDAVVYWQKKGNYTSETVMYKFYSNTNATNLANSIVKIVCNDDLNTTFQREVYGENLGDKLNFYTLNDTNASLSNSDESKLHIKSVICYERDEKTIKKNVKIRIDNTGYWTNVKYGTPTVNDVVINP